MCKILINIQGCCCSYGHLLSCVLFFSCSSSTGTYPGFPPNDRRIATDSFQPKRIFHVLTSLITTISFITYLALATGQGITTKHVRIYEHHKHVPNTHTDFTRQVLWLRYLNWALATPLLFINLALISGLPGANLLIAIVANFIMLAAGLLGSFAGHGRERWVWLTISCISYLVIVHHAGFHAHRAANNKDAQTRKFFGAVASSAIIALALFPM